MLDKSVFFYYILGLCYSKTLIASSTYIKVLRTKSSNCFWAFYSLGNTLLRYSTVISSHLLYVHLKTTHAVNTIFAIKRQGQQRVL